MNLTSVIWRTSKKNMGKLKGLETPSEAELAKAGP